MGVTFHEQNGVIIRRFKGETKFEDMIDSWHQIFARYPNLKDYKGILTSLLDAEINPKENNLNLMVDLLKDHLDELKDLKIAMVMDTPMVTYTIIMGQKVKSLQIKPFATEDAAMRWIER